MVNVSQGNLTKLAEYIIDPANFDISAFNAYVKAQIQVLAAQGEQSNNLMYHLFMVYVTCPDESFKIYIQHQKDQYEDGTLNIGTDELMRKAEQKYKNALLNHSWNQLSCEQEQIIALGAELEAFKKKGMQKVATKAAETPKKKTTLKKNKEGIPIFEGEEKWRNKPPKVGKSHTKVWKDKTYHYCVYHKYWCSHESNACKKKNRKQASKTDEITAALAQVGIEESEDLKPNHQSVII